MINRKMKPTTNTTESSKSLSSKADTDKSNDNSNIDAVDLENSNSSDELVQPSTDSGLAYTKHTSILNKDDNITLTYCTDQSCGYKEKQSRHVHCPFCSADHFLPNRRPGKVQDHLEIKHFAFGVQFDGNSLLFSMDIIIYICIKLGKYIIYIHSIDFFLEIEISIFINQI